MIAATSGEVTDPLVFGDICCTVTRACEEAGEMGRLMRWNEVVMSYLARNHHAPLIQWCGTCGAEAFLSAGDLGMAETCLVEAIRGLEGTGHRSRCVQPNVKPALGHTGEVGLPGTEVIEFSPVAEYEQTMAVLAKNLEAAGGGPRVR
jgi:hypothetical protein